MFVINISNISNGVYKIPFKKGVPYDRAAKVTGILPAGKKCIVPTGVSEYVDIDRLRVASALGVIRYFVTEVPIVQISAGSITIETPKIDRRGGRVRKDSPVEMKEAE
jgi:hypothetical protein